MQAGLYLTTTRGLGSPEARLCYERAETLCHVLNRPRSLYVALIGQWRYSLLTASLSITMQLASRLYALAQEHNDAALFVGAYRALANTHFYLGNFEAAREYAVRGMQIWRAGGVQFPVEEVHAPAAVCLCYKAASEWHLGKISSSRADIAQAISLANELNDMPALANSLNWAVILAYCERNPVEVERIASKLIELSTRHHFAYWLAIGTTFRGWARSVSGDPGEGHASIEEGMESFRATGLRGGVALALRAEALHLAGRSSEALESIREAEALIEMQEERWWSAEIYRLRGVFLAAVGADERQVEASFSAAIRTARRQKSFALATRAKATQARYRLEKAMASSDIALRLPLC
jgi:tetratricopeptide (TPR) repeat protein